MRLERLQLAARRRLVGTIAGEHRSPRHGATLDFADFRDYVVGDDVRRIDVHHLARHDELRITLHDAADDLVLRVLLDTSASMAMHDKPDVAADVVAALGALALASGDAVRLLAFPSMRVPRRFVGRQGLAELLASLRELEWGGDTPFAATARSVLAQPGPPGLTVVVSDLLSPEWHDAIGRLPTRGAELLVVQIGAAAERDPELIGDLYLTDSESGDLVPVSLDDRALAAYRRGREAWDAEVAARCHAVGARHLRLDAGDDVEAVITRSWRRAGVVR